MELFSTEFNLNVFSPRSKQSSRLCVFAEVHSSLFKPHSKSWLQNTRAREFQKQPPKKNIPSPPKKAHAFPYKFQKKTKLQQATKFKGFFKSPPWTTWKNSQLPPHTSASRNSDRRLPGIPGPGLTIQWLKLVVAIRGGSLWPHLFQMPMIWNIQTSYFGEGEAGGQRINNFPADDLKYTCGSQERLAMIYVTCNGEKSSPLRNPWKKFKIIPDQKRRCRNG